MHAEFVEVDLESLLPKIDSLDLQGQLNGVIDFTQKDRLMSPKGSLVINNFEINDFQLKPFPKYEGRNSYEQYQVELFLDTDKARHISATGAIDFSKVMPTVDLKVGARLSRMHLVLLEKMFIQYSRYGLWKF